jgi:hypothetical protein
MASSRRRTAWILGLFIAAAIPLIPDRPVPVERHSELDIELLRSAECQYRGISASFDELTRAYALTVFEEAELQDWTSRPNPNHPDTEALIRCRFLVSGRKADAPEARGSLTAEHRAAVSDIVDVTWKLSTVASVQVQPGSALGQDALDVFRLTVDRLLDRMVYLNEAVHLLDAPDGVAVGKLTPGTLLLREELAGTWAFVRVPSDTTAGWVPDAELRSVTAAVGD